MTARLGLLLQASRRRRGKGWSDHVRALIDIGIAVGDGQGRDRPGQRAGEATRGRPRPGPRAARPRLGPRRAGASCPSLWFPETLKLKAFEVVQLEVEELAFVNEDNGGRYLAFSGGVSIFPGAGQPSARRRARHAGRAGREPAVRRRPAVPAAAVADRRQRAAPSWLLDGVSALHQGRHVRAERLRQHHRRHPRRPPLPRVRARPAPAVSGRWSKDFSIGAQLVYGRVTGPATTSRTGCSACSCPTARSAPFELRGIRMLVAGGMSPDLPEPSGRPQEMRLLAWYKQNSASGAVEVRSDRSQQRGGWKVEQGAEAAGVGADLGLSVSKALILRSFIFFTRATRLRASWSPPRCSR